MDIDKVSFYPLLLDILSDISEAHCVAIDLELSGVCSKDSWGKESGKPTLQERYLETKEAAERYQILQIGLTCIDQDAETGKYTLKPYNFDLCPIINERGLDVERIFSFQSGAAEFLLKVGFDMNRPFSMGVPYLSRDEAKEARDKYARRQDKSAMADILIKPTEVESLAFLERVRGEIKAWIQSNSGSYVNIAPVSHAAGADRDGELSTEELSRFEKRLVHQLVRAEFPELVSISKKGFIQVVPLDQEREDRIAAHRKVEMEERVNRQKGFRWIIEALHGANISNINLRECARDCVTGEQIFADMNDFKAQFSRAQWLLRNKPKVIIGHNCFLDMVYIYRTFIGTLPDTVEEFQTKLHKLWPVIVDTKYMSTHNCGDISPASSLEQIASQLSAQQKPVLDTHENHTKYKNVEAFHEAGYDSFLTAQVAVRLSAKLEREGAYVEVDQRAAEAPNDISNGVASLRITEKASSPTEDENKKNDQAEVPVKGFVPSEPGTEWRRTGDISLGPLDKEDLIFQYKPEDPADRWRNEVNVLDGMPRFGSDFWRVYGNKLRVFGTQEGVCVLDGSAESPVSEDGGVGL